MTCCVIPLQILKSLIETCEDDVNSSSEDENDVVETRYEERYGSKWNIKYNKYKEDLLERMIEDNEKMTDMMTQLWFERGKKCIWREDFVKGWFVDMRNHTNVMT